MQLSKIGPGAKLTGFVVDRTEVLVDYASTVGATQAALARMAGRQIGDPLKGAAAIFQITREPQPLLHLLLGSDALRRTRDQQAQLSVDMQRFEAVTLGTDYPQ